MILSLYRAQHGRLFTSCRAGKIKMVDSFLIQSLNRQSLHCECMEIDKISAKSRVLNVLKTSVFFFCVCVCVFTWLLNLPAKEMSVTHKQCSFHRFLKIHFIHIPCSQVMFTVLLSTNMLREAHVCTVIFPAHITT